MTGDPGPRSSLWIDAAAGVAGDMVLGAFVDAGVPLPLIQAAVDAVIPGTVRVSAGTVSRAGTRATKVDVNLLVPDQPHRHWSTIRDRIEAAELTDGTRARSLAAFGRLAAAEARVHDVAEADVHFHEVGAWDSIADMIGSCAAIDQLNPDPVTISPIAVGSGTVATAHGRLPVPAPAVAELVTGFAVTSGGDGELATPTGVALLTSWADAVGPMPAMTVRGIGIGAGTRDPADRPNVVRIVLGQASVADGNHGMTPMLMLETTVDDLDPRVWPSVIDDLLAAGAADAWLTPVLMKKGRPGQVLSVLAEPSTADGLRGMILARTSTLGVRQFSVDRDALDRSFTDVRVGGGTVAVKIGYRAGLIVHATPEYEQAASLAAATGRPVADVLAEAAAAARAARIVPGGPVPEAPPVDG